MTYAKKSLCALSVFIVTAQNYISQISHVSNAQIDAWTLHDWTGALLNVALSGAFAWKIFLTDPNTPTVVLSTTTQNLGGPSKVL